MHEFAATYPLLFSNAAGQLREDPAGFLRADWSATDRTFAAAQALFEQMLVQLQQRGWSRILVNQTRMVAFSPAEQQWVSQHWLPRAVEAGYRYGAWWYRRWPWCGWPRPLSPPACWGAPSPTAPSTAKPTPNTGWSSSPGNCPLADCSKHYGGDFEEHAGCSKPSG